MKQHWTRHLPNVGGQLAVIAGEIEQQELELEQSGGRKTVITSYIAFLEGGAAACARTHYTADQIEAAQAKAVAELEVYDAYQVN